jgi:hypothetical protein
MLIWFNRPTYIILDFETVRWLRLARGWLEPVLPNLIVGWRGVSTHNKTLAQKPYKLDKVQPKSDEEIASILAYYGSEKPTYAISALIEFIRINSISTNPYEGYTYYQLYPFTYFFILPEPVPPPDITASSKKRHIRIITFLPFGQAAAPKTRAILNLPQHRPNHLLLGQHERMELRRRKYAHAFAGQHC